jgi:undecaprenyl-phosphate 4-deoxy-4-formamido-L-arabinose transferase
MASLSVVVPVYNGALTLPELVARLAEVLPALTHDYEVIFVEDNGQDNSWEVICRLAGDYPWVRGIKLMRNYGQHNALLCGIRAARYDVTVTLDDDLQHPPEEIPRLIAELDRGYDVVYGYPHERSHGLWRNLASHMTKLALQSAMQASTARQASAFRAFRTRVREAFASYQSPFVVIDVLLTWGTAHFSAVPVRHAPRTVGRSNYTFRKLVAHAVNMMTGFSTLPLQWASWIGFAFTLFGICILIYVVGRYVIEGGSVPGFPFLASIIAIFSGVQLFVIGIFGEYLARMYHRTMDRPSYTIRTTSDRPGSAT